MAQTLSPKPNVEDQVVTTTVGAAVATTGASNSSPFGFTTATQADNLVARVNQLRVDLLALVAALQAKGYIG